MEKVRYFLKIKNNKGQKLAMLNYKMHHKATLSKFGMGICMHTANLKDRPKVQTMNVCVHKPNTNLDYEKLAF